MLDAANESTGINYAKRDASADRLWLTQRTKVNPWEHRGSDGSKKQPATPPPPPAAVEEDTPDEAGTTMIAQDDRLRLDAAPPNEVANPFGKLIEHQLQIKLPKEPG